MFTFKVHLVLDEVPANERHLSDGRDVVGVTQPGESEGVRGERAPGVQGAKPK